MHQHIVNISLYLLFSLFNLVNSSLTFKLKGRVLQNAIDGAEMKKKWRIRIHINLYRSRLAHVIDIKFTKYRAMHAKLRLIINSKDIERSQCATNRKVRLRSLALRRILKNGKSVDYPPRPNIHPSVGPFELSPSRRPRQTRQSSKKHREKSNEFARE